MGQLHWLVVLPKVSTGPASSVVLTVMKLGSQPQLLLPSQKGIQRLHKQPHQEVGRIEGHHSLQAEATPKAHLKHRSKGVTSCRLWLWQQPSKDASCRLVWLMCSNADC